MTNQNQLLWKLEVNVITTLYIYVDKYSNTEILAFCYGQNLFVEIGLRVV